MRQVHVRDGLRQARAVPEGDRPPGLTGSSSSGGPAPRTVADPAVAAVIAWFSAEGRALPWRQSRDVYEVWVSEVMSAQTSVTRAADTWRRWIRRWPTVESLAGASLSDVLAEWQGMGYPRRARDLHRSAQIVSADGWPDDLTALPGVGAYVDAAVRCFAREEAVLPRDVNVTRVLRRRFPEGLDTSGDPWRAGQAVMEFGQRICTARPRCGECPVAAGCGGPSADGAAPRPRRQPRYEGSVRQQRGQLLRRAIAERGITLTAADREVAAGLAADGLARLDGDRLLPPD